MTWTDLPSSRAATLAGIAVVLCAFASGAYTYGVLSDRESGTISVTADFETPVSERNVAAEASCERLTLTNEGDRAVHVSIDGPENFSESLPPGKLPPGKRGLVKLTPGETESLDAPQGEYTFAGKTGAGRNEKGNGTDWTVNGHAEATLKVTACSTEPTGTTTATTENASTTATNAAGQSTTVPNETATADETATEEDT